MRTMSRMARIAMLFVLCASALFASVSVSAATPYRGVDFPTPWGWTAHRVGDESMAIARRVSNESAGADFIMRARPGRPDDDIVMQTLLKEARERPVSPGWEKDIETFKGGFVLVYTGRGRSYAHAFLIVRDDRGKSLTTFVGQWDDGNTLAIVFAARKVLREIENR